MRVARWRVTSMSANQRTKCSASFSRAGRSVTLSPRSSGPNMEAARIAAASSDLRSAGLGDGALRERGREQHLVAALVADIELRTDPREMDAERVRRHAKAIGEGRAVEALALTREQLHLAEDAELAPREADGPEVKRRLVECGRTDGRRVVRLRAPQRSVGVRADLSRELARRRIAFGRAPEPRRDLGEVVRESLAAAGADVAHQSRRARRAAA